MVGDGVVAQLRGLDVQFPGIFVGNFVSGLPKQVVEFTFKICSADGDLLAQIFRGDARGKVVGAFKIKF